MEKKEIQGTIIPRKKETSKKEFFDILKLISPGTKLRTALEGVVSYGKGALIVLENNDISPILDGGFRVNSKFTYQKLIELSKMDGAIILSSDLKKILYANVLLTPSSKIKTNETGTRHKAAERTARQTKGLTIAISERKKEITLFYKNKRHRVKNVSEVLGNINEYIQVLERQRQLFDNYLDTLNKLELRNFINLSHAIKTIQKGKIIQKISGELEHYLIEVGNEGKLLKTRLKELLLDVEKETNLIIKDYANIDPKKTILILNDLGYEELLDKDRILNSLGRESAREIISVNGWRILSKTNLTEPEIAELTKIEGIFKKITNTDISGEFEVLPKEKFSLLKVELEKIKLGI
jgi:diadenylate cyclase